MRKLRCWELNFKNAKLGTSLVVQWFKNWPCNAEDTGSISDQETKIPDSCYSVAKSCLTLCNPMDCMCQPPLSSTISQMLQMLCATTTELPCHN